MDRSSGFKFDRVGIVTFSLVAVRAVSLSDSFPFVEDIATQS